jgi:hypothetical protein
MIIRDSKGWIIEYQLFYETPPEKWKLMYGRRCSYKVAPLTLQAKVFCEIVMN